MEEKKQNQEMELSALQMQYKTLQEKFNQQEVVNNDLIHEIIHTRVGDFKRRNVEIILSYGLLAAVVYWSCSRFELRFYFMAVSELLFLFIGLFELLSCRKVLKINTENTDIQTLVQKMENVRTRFSLVWIIGVFALCVWMMWFIFEIGEKLTTPYLRSSFVLAATILAIAIVLIICNIDRLVKMSDDLLAQTSRLNGIDVSTILAYYRGGAYRSGIVMLVLSLVGLVLKLVDFWPVGDIACLAAGLAGEVFVILTGLHLMHIVPDERQVVRIAEVACMFLIACMVLKVLRIPFGNLCGFISLLFFLVAALVYWLRGRRGRTSKKG